MDHSLSSIQVRVCFSDVYLEIVSEVRLTLCVCVCVCGGGGVRVRV